VILRELERKEQVDVGKEQALLDMHSNFEEAVAGLQSCLDRVAALEASQPVRISPPPLSPNPFDHHFLGHDDDLDEPVDLPSAESPSAAGPWASLASKRDLLRSRLAQT